MNYLLIGRLIGNMLKAEAVFMILPLTVGLVYGGGDAAAFAVTIAVLVICGLPLSMLKPAVKNFRAKDACAAAAFSWLFFSLFGALPFYFSGSCPSFIDAVFESVSGFTTTGATIFTDVESLPKGILFFRSFSHWIGGTGVLVLMMAVMPEMNASSVNLLRAESTGPSPGRLVPKIRETAKLIYVIYLALTVLLTALLFLTDLPIFDALIHALSTAGTGGFSNRNASLGAFTDPAAEIIITVFMFLFGTNLFLYFYIFKRNFKQIFKNEEFRLYCGVVIAAAIIIAVNISGLFGTPGEALRTSAFQVSSMISTTSFMTDDYSLWPALSRVILLFLMFSGCCAGSTGGGIKLIRILIVFKAARAELSRIIQPKSVKAVTLNGKKVDNGLVTNACMFFFIYAAMFFVGAVFISLEGKDLPTTLTSVMAMLSNIGMGFGLVGPSGNYASFTPLSKTVFSFLMLAGRLEFFPVLILFNPLAWRKDS